MRPTSTELLKGIRRNIDQYLVPELSSPFAKHLAALIGAFLDHLCLRIEQEGPLLLESNTEIRDTLLSALSRLDGSSNAAPELSEARNAIRARLSAAPHAQVEHLSTESLAHENDELRKLLTDLMAALDAAKTTLEPECFAALSSDTNRCATRVLEKDLALLGPLDEFVKAMYNVK